MCNCDNTIRLFKKINYFKVTGQNDLQKNSLNDSFQEFNLNANISEEMFCLENNLT